MKKNIFICLLLYVFLSCNETFYRPITEDNYYGYKETQIDTNTYQITFSGNQYTNKEKALNYCLFRCAEFTKEKGFNFFSVLEAENLTVSVGKYGVTYPSFVKVIRVIKEKPENYLGVIYSTDEVIKNLAITIIRNKSELPLNPDSF